MYDGVIYYLFAAPHHTRDIDKDESARPHCVPDIQPSLTPQKRGGIVVCGYALYVVTRHSSI